MTDEQCGAVPSLPWFVKPVPVCELAPNHEGCHRRGETLWGLPPGLPTARPDRKDAELARALGLDNPEPWEQMIGRVAALSSMAYRR